MSASAIVPDLPRAASGNKGPLDAAVSGSLFQELFAKSLIPRATLKGRQAAPPSRQLQVQGLQAYVGGLWPAAILTSYLSPSIVLKHCCVLLLPCHCKT